MMMVAVVAFICYGDGSDFRADGMKLTMVPLGLSSRVNRPANIDLPEESVEPAKTTPSVLVAPADVRGGMRLKKRRSRRISRDKENQPEDREVEEFLEHQPKTPTTPQTPQTPLKKKQVRTKFFSPDEIVARGTNSGGVK